MVNLWWNSNKIRTGKLEEDDWTKLAGQMGTQLSEAEILMMIHQVLIIAEVGRNSKIKVREKILEW